LAGVSARTGVSLATLDTVWHPEPMRLTPLFVLALVVTAVGCGGDDPVATPMELDDTGLPEIATGFVGDHAAAEITAACYANFDGEPFLYIVGARVDGEVGLWGVGGLAEGNVGPIQALDDHALSVSDWGRGAGDGSPMDQRRVKALESESADAARECAAEQP
jgi:hypothetical protein